MGALVAAVLVGSVISLAVSVGLPAVLSVTLKVFTPETNEALTGKTALASLELMLTVSVTLVIRFQFASTARTVVVNAAPAVWANGVPVLPAAVPGAAVSPGASNCSFTKLPAITATDGLVFGASVPEGSLAV